MDSGWEVRYHPRDGYEGGFGEGHITAFPGEIPGLLRSSRVWHWSMLFCMGGHVGWRRYWGCEVKVGGETEAVVEPRDKYEHGTPRLARLTLRSDLILWR